MIDTMRAKKYRSELNVVASKYTRARLITEKWLPINKIPKINIVLNKIFCLDEFS
jgi:hypothetical protein